MVDVFLVVTRRIMPLLLAGSAALNACVAFGDNSHDVRFHNTTDVPVNVYETDGRQRGPLRLAQPGETLKNTWIVPAEFSGKIEGSPRRVEAITLSGERIFCHRFSYQELVRLDWSIEIGRRIDCD